PGQHGAPPPATLPPDTPRGPDWAGAGREARGDGARGFDGTRGFVPGQAPPPGGEAPRTLQGAVSSVLSSLTGQAAPAPGGPAPAGGTGMAGAGLAGIPGQAGATALPFAAAQGQAAGTGLKGSAQA